jgi:hypothetical protein
MKIVLSVLTLVALAFPTGLAAAEDLSALKGAKHPLVRQL